jgi:small subunit ribosomal protein S17
MTDETQGTVAKRRRVRQVGTVASIAGNKSVVVRVDRRVKHPKYQKYISRRAKFMAHDEACECAVGDLVELVSSRPLSASKRWRVAKIVRKAIVVRVGKDSKS